MTNSGVGTVDRRDAAIAAALAGMVVIILGYASGVGIKNSDELVSATPAVTAAPQPVATPFPAAPVAVSPPLAGLPRSYVVTLPAPETPTPTLAPTPVQVVPSATATPAPTEPPTSCAPSPLGGLPVVGSVVATLLDTVTPLVSGLLNGASLPLVGASAGADPLTCSLSAKKTGGG